MRPQADHGVMGSALILLFVLAIGPLAVYFGADSRRTSDRRSL